MSTQRSVNTHAKKHEKRKFKPQFSKGFPYADPSKGETYAITISRMGDYRFKVRNLETNEENIISKVCGALQKGPRKAKVEPGCIVKITDGKPSEILHLYTPDEVKILKRENLINLEKFTRKEDIDSIIFDNDAPDEEEIDISAI